MSLLTAIHRQCLRTPDATALAEGSRYVSYAETMTRARLLAASITRNKGPGMRVVVAMNRGIDAAIAILGILMTDASYIPLDLKNPSTRLQFIVKDADPQCVIGKGHCPEWLNEKDLWLDFEAVLYGTPTADYSVDRANSENLAAILYTSGSTGNPKGVALSHRAMKNFSDWAAKTFDITPDDRIASLSPFHFDLSVFDLFSSLSRGASIDFVPDRLTLSPSRLTAWLSERQVSVFYTVPSLLVFLTLKGALSTTPLPNLRTILFAGEVYPTAMLKKLCQFLPHVEFYNLYGPTETNVCCYWRVRTERLSDNQAIPIGIPACGAVLKINPESGGLSVRSANNLSGYWQQGKLTKALSTDGFFDTGDKVSENEQGELRFHGRLDRMLKCSGYRVEPAEIETAIRQSPDVIHCAVVGLNDSAGGRRPAAALVLKNRAELHHVVQSVNQSLPCYMHPIKYVVTEKLPELSNGKIDYLRIQQMMEKG